MVIRSQIAKSYETDENHRMKPNPARGINSDGLLCPVEADDFSGDTLNIIFLGDSFTFGLELADGMDSFPYQVERLLKAESPDARVRCVNFGWTSSSPLLSYRLLREIGAKYRPRLVVLCLDMTDFHDDLRYHLGSPVVGATPIEVIIHHLGLGRWFMLLRSRWVVGDWWQKLATANPVVPKSRFFVVNQPLYKSLPFMRETEENIEDIARYTREKLKAEFALVLLPRSFQYSDRECPNNWEADHYQVGGPFVQEPFKWLEDYQRKVDFPCFSLLDDFRRTTVFPTCFENDPHWTPAGHRVAAEGIIRFLRREGLLK